LIGIEGEEGVPKGRIKTMAYDKAADDEKTHAYVGAVMVVHGALALLLASTPRKGGPLGTMRLNRIGKALRLQTG